MLLTDKVIIFVNVRPSVWPFHSFPSLYFSRFPQFVPISISAIKGISVFRYLPGSVCMVCNIGATTSFTFSFGNSKSIESCTSMSIFAMSLIEWCSCIADNSVRSLAVLWIGKFTASFSVFHRFSFVRKGKRRFLPKGVDCVMP